MLSRPLPALAAVLACALLAGCQPPPPTPTPAPTYQCTPETGGDPYNCSQAQYDDMVATDKLYAEAEAVYRKFLAEDARILRAGGLDDPSLALLETASGEFLRNVLDNYRKLAKRKAVAEGSDPALVTFERAPGRSKTGSDVSANTCVDGRSLKFSQGSKSLGAGRVARDEVYFDRIDGVMKIIGADGEQVEACE